MFLEGCLSLEGNCDVSYYVSHYFPEALATCKHTPPEPSFKATLLLRLGRFYIPMLICMSGFMKMVLKNWTPNLDFNELLGLL